jgi:hypothetical protein
MHSTLYAACPYLLYDGAVIIHYLPVLCHGRPFANHPSYLVSTRDEKPKPNPQQRQRWPRPTAQQRQQRPKADPTAETANTPKDRKGQPNASTSSTSSPSGISSTSSTYCTSGHYSTSSTPRTSGSTVDTYTFELEHNMLSLDVKMVICIPIWIAGNDIWGMVRRVATDTAQNVASTETPGGGDHLLKSGSFSTLSPFSGHEAHER